MNTQFFFLKKERIQDSDNNLSKITNKEKKIHFLQRPKIYYIWSKDICVPGLSDNFRDL